MPLATSSHAVMPPKTLTNTARHLLVAEDHVEPVGHHLRVGAAADVEEVRRLHAAVRLAGVRDDVEGRHHQPRAVADDPDLAVELDVVEALLLGLGLERVGLLADLERRVVLVAEVGVVVERHLAVQRLEDVARQPGQRVDLDQGGVLVVEDPSTASCTIVTACSASSAGKPASATIARAFSSSTPTLGSIGICFTASGLVLATSSISTPPSTLAMQRYCRLARSRRKEK